MASTQIQKVRDTHIDCVKGIGIVLVVFGHNVLLAEYGGFLFRFIYAFHVPLFFYLSGIFFDPKVSFGKMIQAKSKTLLLPYVIVSMLQVVARKAAYGDYDIKNAISNHVYATGETIHLVTTWFLPLLFLVFCFSWVVFNVIKNRNDIYLYVASLLFAILGYYSIHFFKGSSIHIFGYNVSNVGLPWSGDLLLIASFFFVSGYITKKNSLLFLYKSNVLAMASFLVMILVVYFKITHTDMNIREYNNVLLNSIVALCGVCFVFWLSHKISACSMKANNILMKIGRSTLFILLFHSNIQAAVIKMSPFAAINKYVVGMIALAMGVVAPIWIERSITYIIGMLPKRSPAQDAA